MGAIIAEIKAQLEVRFGVFSIIMALAGESAQGMRVLGGFHERASVVGDLQWCLFPGSVGCMDYAGG